MIKIKKIFCISFLILFFQICLFGQEKDNTCFSCDSILTFISEYPRSFNCFLNKKHIPKKVNNAIKSFKGYKLRFANPGKKFNHTDRIQYNLKPMQRLLSYCTYNDIHLVFFEQGGRGYSQNVYIIYFIDSTNFILCDYLLKTKNYWLTTVIKTDMLSPPRIFHGEIEN